MEELPTITSKRASDTNKQKSESFQPNSDQENAEIKSKSSDTNTPSSISERNPQPKKIHPFVYWAQSQSHINLRVDLLQVQDLKVAITGPNKNLIFSAKGKGAHGLQDYHFDVNFHSEVEEKFECHHIERYVLLLIKKALPIKWPRLTLEKIKLPWLRYDFDRYQEEDSDSDNNHCDDYEYSSRAQTYEELRERQRQVRASTSTGQTEFLGQREHNIGDKSYPNYQNMKYDHRKQAVPATSGKNLAKQLDYKKTYLFLYNLIMFVMFLKVYIVLIIKYSNDTMDDEILQGATFIIRMLTYTQLLETLHPILGLVPGGPFMPLLQVFGRIVVNSFLTETAIRLDSAPYAHYLLIVWSSIEIIRYPFYALRVFKIDVYLLTWCRYSLFVPLYPMGGFFESMVVLSSVKYYEKTGEYSMSLPNRANFSFNLPLFLKIYVFLLLGPSIYSLMKYMWSQRAKQLKLKED